MKICAQCQSASPDSALQCPACASVLFEEPPAVEEGSARETELRVLSWDFTFKWVVLFLGGTVLIEVIIGVIAFYVARGGSATIASGIAMSQNFFISIAAILCFVRLSSTTSRPFARASSVYLWSFGISVLLVVLFRGAFLSTFGWVLIGLVCAVLGTVGGQWVRRPNPAVQGTLRDKAAQRP